MYILKWEGIYITLFRIKTDRDSLHCSDIVYRTFLVKICQRDVPVLLVDFDRRNRGRDLNARLLSRYFSFVRLIKSSSVDPRSPLEFQVAM